MLDQLYENIGGKIKAWAKWIFAIEALAAVITGIALLFEGDEYILYGILTIVLGPIVACVSTWLLYAFGELVEKTVWNERNTREIANLLGENPGSFKDKKVIEKKVVGENPGSFKDKKVIEKKVVGDVKSTHKWRCDSCGNMRTETPCEHCGVNENAGEDTFVDVRCPNCGEALSFLNVEGENVCPVCDTKIHIQ